ncbi:MAG: MFS transporter [Rhizobium sp.]|nr:MFS transporter [Rhizobium sp.]
MLAAFAEATASTIFVTGRLDIMGDTHATPDELAWLDVNYIAAKIVGLFLAPWMMSRLGGTFIIRASVGLLTLTCGLAALTDETNLLAMLRGLQGFAGGVFLVSAQTALFQVFAKTSQPLVQALFAIGAVVAPAALLPLSSGWTIDTLSWVWIYLTATALGLAALLLIASAGAVETKTEGDSLNIIGIALLVITAFATTFSLNQGNRWNWLDEQRVIVLSTAGAIAAMAFIVIQLGNGRKRLIHPGVFRSQDFTFAFGLTFVAGFALTGSSYLIPAFAISVLGVTPTEAGWLLLPSGLVFIAALITVALCLTARLFPPLTTAPFGVLCFMTAMWLLSTSTLETGADQMEPALMLRGLGLGLLFLSLTLIALGGLPRELLAHGVALFNFCRLFGGQIGTASLQTFIDHSTMQNIAVLAANIPTGDPLVLSRLMQISATLIERGIDPAATSRAASTLLGRQVSAQAGTIAFNDAFLAIALLFIAAAPLVLIFRSMVAWLSPKP